MSAAPTTTVTVSTGAWPYVALGLVVTLLVAGILGGLAARRDGLCCARTRPVEGAAEVQEVEAKSRQRPIIEPKSFSIASGGMLPPEEAADPDLILLTTGGIVNIIIIQLLHAQSLSLVLFSPLD